MTRYSHLRWLAPLGGLVAAGIIALSAVPAGSTLVCPNGVTPPSPYCSNVPPTATTGSASPLTGTSATLNGIAGANVATGGDNTLYFFEYGTTLSYGKRTPTGTIHSCPSGVSPPSPYCAKTQAVSADISRLTPCTIYHFQLFASNPDGSANGGDTIFKTTFANPLSKVKSPKKVKAGHKFQVNFKLKYSADVQIIINNNNGTVFSQDYGVFRPGPHHEKIKATFPKGNYNLVVVATLSCGPQTVSHKLKVH